MYIRRSTDVFWQGQEAAVSQKASPQLDAHNAEDEEDKEAEEQDVAQHGKCVQQQHHQDPHACKHTWNIGISNIIHTLILEAKQ